jgi:inosine/xanthosine triphosphatase
MKTVVIASQNPVKTQAAISGFNKMFPGEQFWAETISAPSGVKEQPLTDEETLIGALNRANNAKKIAPQADFWVGIEGGIEERDGDMTAFAWIVVCGKSKDSKIITGKGRTGTFFLPSPIANLIRRGKELGEADDIIFQRDNSKQENGAVGLLTGNVINRQQLYEQAVILALIPLKNPILYTETVLE